MVNDILAAIGRFFGFFFTLVATIAISTACYSAVAGQPVDKTWSAVEALVITALFLLGLALLSAGLADRLAPRSE